MKTLKFYTLFFSLFLIINVSVTAQTIVRGIIKTNKGIVIKGANIAIKNTYDGTSSDSAGRFSFKTYEKGDQYIFFSAIGYAEDSVKTNLDTAPADFTLILKQKINELDAVTVSAGTFEASDSKKGTILNSLDVATTAGAEADVFAALQTLPGTQQAFAESGLFVRGGSAAETNTYFDGLLVKTPFNTTLPDQASRGRFSPFLFKGTTFSAGGYSAVYGQALSSALILESKDLPAKSTTDISIMTVGAGINQNLKMKNSSLSFGGNYINLKPAFTLFKQGTDWIKEPESLGGTIIYKLKTSKTGILKFYNEYSQSNIGLNSVNLDSPVGNQFGVVNKNLYSNLTYQDFLSDKWKINGGFSASNNDDNGNINTDKFNRTDKLVQSKITATRFLGVLSTLKFGADWQNSIRDESFNLLKRDYTDHLFAAYTEGDIYLSNSLVARVGLRAEYSSYLKENNIAPRLSLAYKTGTYSQASFAYGKFFQNPDDQYLVQTNTLKFEKADHYLLNYQYSAKGQTLRVEGFIKNYDGLTKTIPTLNNNGNGFARGVDFFWRDKKTFKGMDYWVSYSFLDTKRNFQNYPIAATPAFGAKHTLNIVYKQYFSKLNSQIGATYSVASGRPYFNPNQSDFMADRTKPFQNLSMNISYLTKVFSKFTVIYASVSNLPGFKNVYGYNYSNDGSVRQAIQPPALRSIFVGMFITLGDNTFIN